MPIKTLKLTGTFDHVSAFDDAKGTPEATVFNLRMLDSRVMGQLRDSATSYTSPNPEAIDTRGATILNIHEANFKTTQFGIVGWRNLFDDEGNEIKFATVIRFIGSSKYDVCDPEILKTLPQSVIDELAVAIKNGNIVTKDEAKN